MIYLKFVFLARSHNYGRQKNDNYDDDYDDNYYSYDNSAATTFSGFGGVSYNPEDNSDEDESEEDSDDSATDEESEEDEELGELTSGLGNLC